MEEDQKIELEQWLKLWEQKIDVHQEGKFWVVEVPELEKSMGWHFCIAEDSKEEATRRMLCCSVCTD